VINGVTESQSNSGEFWRKEIKTGFPTSLIVCYEENGTEHFAIVPLLTITAAMSPAQNIYKESRKGSSEIEGKGAHGSNERAKKIEINKRTARLSFGVAALSVPLFLIRKSPCPSCPSW
jgi:hypothetical protein